MPLPPATRLGPYEILSALGAGGMGEVYRAKDTRLDRVVAVKVLPEHRSSSPEIRERFEREARVISSLSHPHICALYDIGSEDGIDYLVMEYLEDETLASRLRKGPLRLEQTWQYAIQIASALDHAHRHGIVHRDLKPSNIMLTKMGAKLLDFGLAKVRATEAAGGVTNATNTLTEEGVILGTLQYMSPEQLEGKEADARADIFALGAVVYEMATGKKAFQGQSRASLIVAIMERQPQPISAFQPLTPPALDHVVTRCLAKDPDERWQSAHDLRSELQWMAESSAKPAALQSPKAAHPGIRRLSVLIAGMIMIALIGTSLAFWLRRPEPTDPPVIRPLTYSGHDGSPAASRDRRTIAYTSDRDGSQRLWLKDLAMGGEVALTSGPSDWMPRFSPDGSTLLFMRREGPHFSLYRVATVGGEPRKLVDNASGGDWAPDGRRICFVRHHQTNNGRTDSAIMLVAANGEGEHEIARIPDQTLTWPRWSPNGSTISVVNPFQGVPPAIFLVSADGKDVRPLSPPREGFAISSAAWNNTGDELVYSQAESAMAGFGFGSASPAWLIRQNVKTGSTRRFLAIPYASQCLDIVAPGKLVFDVLSPRQSLREVSAIRKTSASSRWLTRGNSQDRQPVYSPDGEWVLFTSNRSGTLDLFAISVRNGKLRQITDHPADDMAPNYTRDGKHIVWSSNRSGHFEIWIATADGNDAKQLTKHLADSENPTATPDGWIVYENSNRSNSSDTGIWKIRQDGSMAVRIMGGEVGLPEVSPDGQFLAYLAGETLYVARTSDAASVVWEVRGVGGFHWMPSGRAIAFIIPSDQGSPAIFVQDFVPGHDTSRTRRRVEGLEHDTNVESFGISPDGSRFTAASVESVFNLMVADRVSGIAPPERTTR